MERANSENVVYWFDYTIEKLKICGNNSGYFDKEVYRAIDIVFRIKRLPTRRE
jgi:UDP-N-acetyl-D-mannosaminuronic acid transferase (WecB/TagA/CpsF family)